MQTKEERDAIIEHAMAEVKKPEPKPESKAEEKSEPEPKVSKSVAKRLEAEADHFKAEAVEASAKLAEMLHHHPSLDSVETQANRRGLN